MQLNYLVLKNPTKHEARICYIKWSGLEWTGYFIPILGKTKIFSCSKLSIVKSALKSFSNSNIELVWEWKTVH